MIDQSHSIEPKIPAMVRSVLNIQTQYAQTLLVDHEAIHSAKQQNEVIAAENAVREAFEIEIRSRLATVREEQGLPIDLKRAFHESGYSKLI